MSNMSFQNKPVISPAWNLGIISAAVVVCAIGLAFSELPEMFLNFNTFQRWQSALRHGGVELLRAAVLVVNVQVLSFSGKGKYYIILGLTIVSTGLVGASIYFNHLPGPWSSPDFYTSQALNLLILTGELSLTFLLAGKGISFDKLSAELQRVKSELTDQLTRVKSELTQVKSRLESLYQKVNPDQVKNIDELEAYTLGVARELNRVKSELTALKGKVGRGEEVTLEVVGEYIDDLNSKVEALQLDSKVNTHNKRIFREISNLSVNGKLTRTCTCGSIVPFPGNAYSEAQCPVCKEMVRK